MILRSTKMLLIGLILLASRQALAYDSQVTGYIGYVEHSSDGSFTFTLASAPNRPDLELSTVCTTGSWPHHVGVSIAAGNTPDGAKAFLASVMMALAAGRQVTIFANLSATSVGGSNCLLVVLDSF
jgi:hypothetical protein